ncbi:MAG TPA: OmpA family protein [Polyangiales bacterium]|nr:OmpA family protein [Polyangiales bacterium]
MRHRRSQMLRDEEGENFWPSFTDLISTISMILFVLVLLAYIQNLISGKALDRTKTELAATSMRLRASQQEITTSERKLKLLATQIEAGLTQLKLSQAQVEQQQAVISDSTKQLTDVRARLQGIAVLRVEVLQKVKASIDQQMKTAVTGAAGARIAENGNIVIDESLVFESNSYTIRPEGKRFLDSVAKAFANVLDDTEVRQNIDTILVQGHTDERGTVAYNRELSARRANAVLDYMFVADPTLNDQYGAYFASSAYSEFRPLSAVKNEQAYEKNRRIEISVVLKDASVRSVIDEYMKSLDPMVNPPAGAP